MKQNLPVSNFDTFKQLGYQYAINLPVRSCSNLKLHIALLKEVASVFKTLTQTVICLFRCSTVFTLNNKCTSSHRFVT